MEVNDLSHTSIALALRKESLVPVGKRFLGYLSLSGTASSVSSKQAPLSGEALNSQLYWLDYHYHRIIVSVNLCVVYLV
jgi:hypothetical protein